MHDSQTSLQNWIDAKKHVEPSPDFQRTALARLERAQRPPLQEAPATPWWSRPAWRLAFTLLALGVGLLRFAYLAVTARLIAS